ncbi:lysostaphin resistance A-like protein [Shouchella sp. JSM 1781072]|uniref:CPBP family intramembrane glutamic endopeptidase n=1 Tax=Bacillaceae TaxID=186817 RepID=UPI000C07447F|nr:MULTISPECIES: CPBP family intramembrane glutamic endopeptidase [Bacillaceae]UTR06887.1 CPBP family intramembrane metalloprotease [Alkalihalobacillus sp. LMS6]
MTDDDKQLQWAVWQGFLILVAIGLALILLFRFGEMLPFLQSLFVSERYSFLFQVVSGLVIGLVVAFVTLGVLKVTKTTLPRNELTDLLRTMVSSPAGLFAVVVGAPIVEEFLFRGVLIGLFVDIAPVSLLIGVNALLFMLVHVPQYRGLPILHLIIFFVGLLLAYLFVATGALIVPILVHCIYNLIVGIAMRKMV